MVSGTAGYGHGDGCRCTGRESALSQAAKLKCQRTGAVERAGDASVGMPSAPAPTEQSKEIETIVLGEELAKAVIASRFFVFIGIEDTDVKHDRERRKENSGRAQTSPQPARPGAGAGAR